MKSVIEAFDRQFINIHLRSVQFIKMVPGEMLYLPPRETNESFLMFSCGEYILRSAAAVEQTFGGIMTRLWDDPFEWTLPEALSTNDNIVNYLQEVEETRRKGFCFFQTDEDLKKEMPAPEKLKSIATIMLETIARAEHFQGRAFAIFQCLSDGKLPRV